MRLILSLTAVFGVAAAAAVWSQPADAGKASRVVIAHLASVEDVYDQVTGDLVETDYCYVVIEISENGLNGHSHHDDAQDGGTLADGSTFTAADYSVGDQICFSVPAGM